MAIAEFIGFGFAIGEPSLEVAYCPLFDIALCFLIGSERKLLKWLQENIEKFMMLNQTKMIPLITRETPFGQHISELVFGVNIFDWDLVFSIGFCRTTNKKQLCGFWTRVSLLDFVL